MNTIDKFNEHIMQSYGRYPLVMEQGEGRRCKDENGKEYIGTGIGLPIVQYAVKALGGEIKVESKVGVGTKITVTLPHRIAQPADTQSYIEKAQGYDENCFKGKRILLAEDNELNRELAEAIFTEAGFLLEMAENGKLALEMLQAHEAGYYDLIISDIQMPVMDGYELSRQVRRLEDGKKAGIPILALTANAFEEDRQQVMEAQMNGHLAKPIDMEEVLKTIKEVLSI